MDIIEGPEQVQTEEISAELRREWAKHDMVPLWESPNGAIQRGPSETARIWNWRDMRPILVATAKITSPSIIERRVLQLVNRQIAADADATTGMMNATLQALMPGERARTHRHTMNALRFILEGTGAETIVDGKPCAMEVGDLVTTPAMTWHEHRNATGAPTFWLDVLDVYLHRLVGRAVFQPGPVKDAMPAHDDACFATPNIVPVLEGAERLPHSPVFRYPYADAVKALASAPQAADGSKTVRYMNPVTGGPCMALLDCFMIELPEGQQTMLTRSSASAICSVVEGEGVSRIEEMDIAWQPKDTFTLPQHTSVMHRAVGGTARIFVATNREAYRRLGLLDERAVP